MSNCVFCDNESYGNYPEKPYICASCYSEIYEVVDNLAFGYENQMMYHENDFGGSMHQRVDGGDYPREYESVVYFGEGVDNNDSGYAYIRACKRCGDAYRTDYFLNFVCDRCLEKERIEWIAEHGDEVVEPCEYNIDQLRDELEELLKGE